MQVKTRVQEQRLQDRMHERVQEHLQREGAARREEPVAEEVRTCRAEESRRSHGVLYAKSAAKRVSNFDKVDLQPSRTH